MGGRVLVRPTFKVNLNWFLNLGSLLALFYYGGSKSFSTSSLRILCGMEICIIIELYIWDMLLGKS